MEFTFQIEFSGSTLYFLNEVATLDVTNAITHALSRTFTNVFEEFSTR